MSCTHDKTPTDRMAEIAINAIEKLEQENKRLREALEKVQIGGNSLPSIFGVPHLLYTANCDEAREFFYNLDKDNWFIKYEAWLCWKTIREAGEVLEP